MLNICDFWVIIWMSPYTSAPILFRCILPSPPALPGFTSFIKALIKAATKSTRAVKMVCLFIILDQDKVLSGWGVENKIREVPVRTK